MKKMCERCKQGNRAQYMSMFNSQMLCSACYEEEKTHPDYAIAEEAFEKDKMGYDGIGLPADLKEKYKVTNEEE